jgi:CRISPR/Cas system-associated protein Csm6
LYGKYNKFAAVQKMSIEKGRNVLTEATAGFKPYPKWSVNQ